MNEQEKILVLGIGTSGCNAVNYMIDNGLTNVEFWAVNTDSQLLELSKSPRKLQIGVKTTEGLGACGNPEIGYKAASESKENIDNMLNGADMVFLVSGMGGGTGGGATPYIAKIAKEKGILTVGIVTKPFKFEGRKRTERAFKPIEELKLNTDILIVIENEKTIETIEKTTSLKNAFLFVDEILKNIVESIVNLIFVNGIINVDFDDLKNILKNSGIASVLTAKANGENKIQEVCNLLINGQFNNLPIKKANSIIMNILSSPEAKLHDVNKIADFMHGFSDEAEIIFGWTVDDNLKDEIKITVIGTNFDKKYLLNRARIEAKMQDEIVEIEEKYNSQKAFFNKKKHREIQEIKNKYQNGEDYEI